MNWELWLILFVILKGPSDLGINLDVVLLENLYFLRWT